MISTEWLVECDDGHRFFERIDIVPPAEVEFSDCPKCGAIRRGSLLRPLEVRKRSE